MDRWTVDTDQLAGGGARQGHRHLLDGPAAEGVTLPLGGEQPQLLLLVLGQLVAVSVNTSSRQVACTNITG